MPNLGKQAPVPERVGPYRIEGELGRGGMGVVYLALDERLGRRVALKSVPEALASRPELKRRLEREARLLAQLSHANIATIHGMEEDAGRLYLVLEHLDGETLASRLSRGPLGVEEALGTCRKVAEALSSAHRHGIVHRDLKPGNVMITSEGVVKVLDFGLAMRVTEGEAEADETAETRMGTVLGTPAYMSPEQATAGDVGPASDVWSFGCVLHECLSGRKLWSQATASERLRAILSGDADLGGLPAETPPEVLELIRGCLQKEAGLRPQDLDEVVSALDVSAGRAAGTRRAGKGNLRRLPTSFVGRERDLTDLGARLAVGARLVTVLGPAGTGKTRLVQEHGLRETGSYPGGVWFCDLTEARSVEGIASAVGAALGVPLAGREPVTQLGHAIAGRGRCLVLLDNFEQVAEHASATVGAWIGRAPEARLVATSRVRLGIGGEQVLELEPLSQSGSVELFVERARAARREFVLDAVSEAEVRALVELLDRLPLAIELAAARLRVLSLAQIASRLGDRFRLLAATRGETSGHHVTLRAALDWSWDLLRPWEQTALAQLSVFEGGFTLEAAEAVLEVGRFAEAPWAMDVVQELVEKSLVRRRQVETDVPRFTMLVSVKQYAAEKLRASGGEEEGWALARHGAYYAGFGSQDALEALDRHGGVARRRRLESELENLVSACRRSVGRADRDTAVATLGAASAVLDSRGPIRTAVGLGQEVLALPALSAASRALVLAVCGRACWKSGLIAEGRRYLEDALAIHRAHGDQRGMAGVLCSLGLLHKEQGRMEDGRRDLEEALAVAREVGNRLGEAVALCNLGILHLVQCSVEEARRRFEEALAIDRELGNRKHEGLVLGNLGTVDFDQGRIEDARRHFEAALAVLREVADRRNEGVNLGNLGNAHAHHGSLEKARRCFEEALAVDREVGSRRPQGYVLQSLGELALEQGQMEEAQQRLQEALAVSREAGERALESHVLAALGNWLVQQGQTQEARQHYDDALAMYHELGDRRHQGSVLSHIGLLDAREGRFHDARSRLVRGEALLRDVGDRFELVKLLCRRAECQSLEGDLAAARETLIEAEALLHAIGSGPDSLLMRVIAQSRAAVEGLRLRARSRPETQ